MQQPISNQGGTVGALFISPHLDDAVLSAAHTIESFVQRQKRIAVVTLFTQGSPQTSRDIQIFLKQCNSVSSNSLFKKRKKEDIRALNTLGVTDIHHLGFVDGLFRTSNNHLIYPTFRSLFCGHVSSKDAHLASQITLKLTALIRARTDRQTHIYTCLGVGTHADHIITHNIVTALLGKRTTYWEDVPYRSSPIKLYVRQTQIHTRLHRTFVDSVKYAKNKKSAVYMYASQLPGLFQGGLGTIDYLHEVLYVQ